MKDKIKTVDEVAEIAASLKKTGKKIVTTNGCFDLLHAGHVSTFHWAKSQGDVLIVGVNSDLSVRDNKDPGGPSSAKTSERS